MKNVRIRNTRIVKSLFVFLLTAAVLFAAAAPVFAAVNGDPTEVRGEIVGISNRGLRTQYPENSLAAVHAAAEAGLDCVLVDVSSTSDGVLVLAEMHSAARMLGADTEDIADYTYNALAAMPLKNRVGGKGNGDTPYSISTLAEAIADTAQAGITLVLKFDVSLCDAVNGTEGAENCIWYITGKTKDQVSAVQTYGETRYMIAEKRSNIIFSVLSFVRKVRSAGAVGAVLKTTNRYGVIYYKSTLAKCDGLRVIADTSEPVTAGAREDTFKWWDDLISRGYSAIITDDAEGFANYLAQNTAARERLKSLYTKVQSMTLPDMSGAPFSDYTKAYNDAVKDVQALLSDLSPSTRELQDAYAALNRAVKDLELNFEAIEAGTAGNTVTLPRILLCVGAAAAVIAVQLYFFKRRKKPDSKHQTPNS